MFGSETFGSFISFTLETDCNSELKKWKVNVHLKTDKKYLETLEAFGHTGLRMYKQEPSPTQCLPLPEKVTETQIHEGSGLTLIGQYWG